MYNEQHKFKGKWITSDEFCELNSVNVFHRQLEEVNTESVAPKNSHILFRNKFNIQKCGKTYIYINDC